MGKNNDERKNTTLRKKKTKSIFELSHQNTKLPPEVEVINAMQIVRLSNDFSFFFPFTDEVDELYFHFVDGKGRRCLGMGCPYCEAGYDRKPAVLWPTYEIPSQDFGILRIGSTPKAITEVRSLYNQILPFMKPPLIKKCLVGIKRTRDGFGHVVNRFDLANVNVNHAAIDSFEKRLLAGEIDLKDACPIQTRQELIDADPKLSLALGLGYSGTMPETKDASHGAVAKSEPIEALMRDSEGGDNSDDDDGNEPMPF